MIKPRWLFLLASLLLLAKLCHAQKDNSREVLVKGMVYQDTPIGYGELLIVNKRTNSGTWGKGSGEFEMVIHKSDTLHISSRGYHKKVLSFADSIYRDVYHVKVYLNPLTVLFDKPITIRPKVEITDIPKQQKLIGSYRKPSLFNSPVDYLTSPISALYSAFSKKEQEKREYYALLNEKATRDAVTSVTQYYVQNGLFYIEDDQVDRFLDYCNLPMNFIKKASLYELGVELKKCHEHYEYKEPVREFRY